MPTYQYACTECGHRMDVVQSFTDDALTECPACQGRLRKLFGNVGVVFKGSGFYRNDSRSGSTSSGDSAAKTESAPGAKTTESTKPAATAAKDASTSKPSSATTTPAA